MVTITSLQNPFFLLNITLTIILITINFIFDPSPFNNINIFYHFYHNFTRLTFLKMLKRVLKERFEKVNYELFTYKFYIMSLKFQFLSTVSVCLG